MKKSNFLTEAAIEELTKIFEEQNFDKSNTWIKIGMKGGGCSGFTYILDFCERKDEFDLEYEEEGIKLVIDKKSDFFMQGVTIDFNTSLLDRGFKFINPQATSTCGCGVSFSV
jgi:iron-sulfur cluster assembly protein